MQLLFTQLNVGPYVEIEVKMYAAMGAARVVFTGSATLGGTTSSTAGGSVAVAPGANVTAASTTGASGSVTAGTSVTFPDASLVIEYDCGFFQWQCVPPKGTAVFRLDLAHWEPPASGPSSGSPQQPPSEERPAETTLLSTPECGKPFSLRVRAWGATENAARFKAQQQGLVDAGLACPGSCPNVQEVSWTDHCTELAPGLWECSGVGDYVCRQ